MLPAGEEAPMSYSVAITTRALRVQSMINGEAVTCGHEPHWNQPRRVSGFYILLWRCRRCKVRSVVYVYEQSINAEVPIACVPVERKR